MTFKSFNFFKVLEKDNKELVHSAFLKYLMQLNNTFYTDFIEIEKHFLEPKLERQYSLSKKEKGRFDIEAISEDNATLVVIENKFKSFPYREQFFLYDKILKKHHKDKIIFRLLICFDKSFVENYQGWIIADYSDLLLFIEKHYNMDSQEDHSIFIRHYYNALSDYFQQYRRLGEDFRELFSDLFNDSNKFWLKLFYSALKVRLESYMAKNGIEAEIYVNNGNTTVPLINIVPKGWTIDNNELLIQMQGNDIKFYSHSKNKPFLSDIKGFAQKQFSDIPYEYKKETKRQSNTQFILKTKLLQENTPIDVDYLFNRIIQFYITLNENVIQGYVQLVPSSN